METKFFLGSNSDSGFYSLYDNFVRAENGDFLWVIKGGPGCGKSSFIRKVGEAAAGAGFDVEYIQCSGDPGSLDGVYIPALKTAYMDGTSPHVMEAAHPAADSLYLDLGAFYDYGSLEKYRGDVLDIGRRYKELYKRAYDFTAAASAVSPIRAPGLLSPDERDAALSRADSMIARELGKRKSTKCGTATKRFLSGVTCDGLIFHEETLSALCDRVYTLDNNYGLANDYLRRTNRAALERGIDTLVCPDPLMPERTEAILLPELGLGFLAISPGQGYSGTAYRHIRLDALVDHKRIRGMRPAMRRSAKLYRALMSEATLTLFEAKSLHDELESIYNPHVDFDGIYALAAGHINALIG